METDNCLGSAHSLKMNGKIHDGSVWLHCWMEPGVRTERGAKTVKTSTLTPSEQEEKHTTPLS